MLKEQVVAHATEQPSRLGGQIINSSQNPLRGARPHCTVIGLATRGIIMIESCSVIVLTAK